jgi:hypothetical protein
VTGAFNFHARQLAAVGYRTAVMGANVGDAIIVAIYVKYGDCFFVKINDQSFPRREIGDGRDTYKFTHFLSRCKPQISQIGAD